MLRLDINLLFTVINLLIIYFIVRKLLFKPIKAVIAKRQEEIDAQYEGAKETEEIALELKKKYEDSLSTVASEKAAVVNEARTKASAEYDRIVSDAKKEADRLLENAKKQADAEQEKSVRQAREQIAELVVAATAKVVASGQGQDADRELYNRFLAKTGEQ
jgi:F-type H+-transporting ATPase subunit b